MGKWIEWSGGLCPVTDRTVVEIETRNGMLWSPDIATRYYWHHNGDASDIIRYRVVGDEAEHDPDTPVKTLRDEFAMAALTGLLAGPYRHSGTPNLSEVSEDAWHIADAMLAAREEGE